MWTKKKSHSIYKHETDDIFVQIISKDEFQTYQIEILYLKCRSIFVAYGAIIFFTPRETKSL